MSEDRSLPYGGPLPASWLAALQEFVGTVAVNFHLSLANDHTVQVTAGTDRAQVGLGIGGLFRYITTAITAAVTGAAGAYDIFAVTGPNVFTPVPGGTPPESDDTDYTFGLQVLAAGTTPTLGGAVTNYRKVGELDWDGAKITGFRALVGDIDARKPLSATAPTKDIVASRVVGAVSQAAALETWESPLGTVVASMAPNGGLTLAALTLGGVAVTFTAGQIAALAGTSGTPGSGNKYVTDADARNSNARAPTGHHASHESGGSDALAGLALSQFAAGVARPRVVVKSANYTLSDGDFVLAGSGGGPLTMTLPTPALGVDVIIKADSLVTATNKITIAPHAAELIDLQSSLVLGQVGAFVRLVSDGTNWWIAAGQQDTGWLPITPAAGFGASLSTSAGASFVASARRQGDTIKLRGGLTNSSGATAVLCGTIPAGLRPPAVVVHTLNTFTIGNTANVLVATDGTLQFPGGLPTGQLLPLDEIEYPLS